MLDPSTLGDLTLSETATAALVLGIFCHLTIRPFEIDGKSWHLVGSYACVLSFVASLHLMLFDLSSTFVRTSIIAAAFNAGLAASILVYRGFFHRLRHFPGPFLAKFSRFYATFNAAQRLQANVDVQKLHACYGDLVRVGPREISINRPSAISAIYGNPSRCTRSPWYSQVSNDVTKISLNSTRDLEVHRRRKKAWERGLGFRALSSYEPRIQAKVDMLVARLDATNGEPVDITKYAMFFGFDVMGDVGFSKDFRMLESGHEHPAIRGLHDNMAAVGILGTVPWLLSMLSKIPGATGSYTRFTDWCGQELRAKRMLMNARKSNEKQEDPRDVMSWLLKAEHESDRSAPPGEGAFQEDSRLMIIAGSDTTSVALANAVYYLTRYPNCYRKLQHLILGNLSGGEQNWGYEKIKDITYLDYIIQETLRLKPSIPAGLSRLTPDSGLQIDDIIIPGDTIVSVPAYTIQRDPRYWEDALEFIPDRWEALSTEKAPWIPFTRGQFSCPGRNLAFMELRMAISRIALRFDLSFVSEEDGEIFDNDAKDTFTLNVPPLPIVFTRRQD